MSVRTGTGGLEDIIDIEKAWFTADEVAKLLHTTADTLRKAARQNPAALGFPVCVLGSSIRIPRDGFLFWMQYGSPKV